MPTTTYSDLADKVLSWSNRDLEVFGGSATSASENTQIQDFLRYAADKCYRHLRVPSLEYTRQFTVETGDFVNADREVESSLGFQTINLPVPQDLIDVIYIRSGGCVYNEKVDQRTFYDTYSVKKSDAYWTRTGNIFQVSGRIDVGTVFEIHYYRRLPALNATYTFTALTYIARSGLFSNFQIAADQGGPEDTTQDGVVWFPDGTTATGGVLSAEEPPVAGGPVALDSRTTGYTVGITATGEQIEHWLRDQNERIVLFGALMEAFNFLDEQDQVQKFAAMFEQEIAELNQEEKMRQATGGNISVNFTSHLI